MSLKSAYAGVECQRFGNAVGNAVGNAESVTSAAPVTLDRVTQLERENAALRLQVAKLTAELADRPKPPADDKRAKTAARVAAFRARQKAG